VHGICKSELLIRQVLAHQTDQAAAIRVIGILSPTPAVHSFALRHLTDACFFCSFIRPYIKSGVQTTELHSPVYHIAVISLPHHHSLSCLRLFWVIPPVDSSLPSLPQDQPPVSTIHQIRRTTLSCFTYSTTKVFRSILLPSTRHVSSKRTGYRGW